MRLAEPREVLAAMGVMESAAALNNAGQALDLSLPVLEKVLDTLLSKASVIDFFDYAGPTSVVGFQTYTLRLTRGFVDPYSVEVRYGERGASISTDSPGEVLDPSAYRLDATKGVIHLLRPLSRGCSALGVWYDAGFENGDEIPDTLRALAVSSSVLYLNVLPSTPANRTKDSVSPVSRSVYGFLHTQAAPLERPRMAVEYPTSSEVS